MKNQVKEYEKFIREKIANKEFSKELLAYHNEMIHCFQHERLVHLIITLFFVVIAIFFLILTGLVIGNGGEDLMIMWPLYVITLIVTILAIAYVRYYHFLENHIQELYRLTSVLAGIKTGKNTYKKV